VSCLVLDSYAILAFLQDEPSADTVENVLDQAPHDPMFRLMMSRMNWGEVYYSIYRTHGADRAEKVVNLLDRLPIEIIDIDKEIVYRAAILKGKHRIAFGDCFAAALAILNKCPVMTGDNEFNKFKEEVPVKWLR
jgi:uncharacterized protein